MKLWEFATRQRRLNITNANLLGFLVCFEWVFSSMLVLWIPLESKVRNMFSLLPKLPVFTVTHDIQQWGWTMSIPLSGCCVSPRVPKLKLKGNRSSGGWQVRNNIPAFPWCTYLCTLWKKDQMDSDPSDFQSTVKIKFKACVRVASLSQHVTNLYEVQFDIQYGDIFWSLCIGKNLALRHDVTSKGVN